MYTRAFIQWYCRNQTLPSWHEHLKISVILSGLIQYKLNEEAPCLFWIDHLLLQLASKWKLQKEDILGAIDQRLKQLMEPPKRAVKRFDDLKHLKMALILSLDLLFYKDLNPKVTIALELLDILDRIIAKKQFDKTEKSQIDCLIDRLHRLYGGKLIDELLARFSYFTDLNDPKWSIKHRYDDLYNLRKSVEGSLYRILFPDYHK